jgi:hypothetical protein
MVRINIYPVDSVLFELSFSSHGRRECVMCVLWNEGGVSARTSFKFQLIFVSHNYM